MKINPITFGNKTGKLEDITTYIINVNLTMLIGTSERHVDSAEYIELFKTLKNLYLYMHSKKQYKIWIQLLSNQLDLTKSKIVVLG